jgi:hypothetical protein
MSKTQKGEKMQCWPWWVYPMFWSPFELYLSMLISGDTGEFAGERSGKWVLIGRISLPAMR